MREQRKYVVKKRAEKRRKLFLRRKHQFRRHCFHENSEPRSWIVVETFSYTTFIVLHNVIKLILYILFPQNGYKNSSLCWSSQPATITHLTIKGIVHTRACPHPKHVWILWKWIEWKWIQSTLNVHWIPV